MNERVNEYDELYDDIYDYDVNEVLNVKEKIINYDLNDNITEKNLTSEYKLVEDKFEFSNEKQTNCEQQKDDEKNTSIELNNMNSCKQNIENEYDEYFHGTRNIKKEEENDIENFEKKDNKNHLNYNINKFNTISINYKKNETSHEILSDETKIKEYKTNYCGEKIKSINEEINSKNDIDEKISNEEVDVFDNIIKKNLINDKEKNEFHENKSTIFFSYGNDEHENKENKQNNDIINKNNINENYDKVSEIKEDAILKENEFKYEKNENSKTEENEFKYEKNENSKTEENEFKYEKNENIKSEENENIKSEENENIKSEENEFKYEKNENSKSKEDLLNLKSNNESSKSKENNLKCEEDEIKRENQNKNAYSENENRSTFECNICFDDVRDPVVTKCGHLFCWLCLCSWIKKNNDCPVCKAEVSRENVIPLYGRGNSSNQHKYANVDEPRPTPKRKEGVRRNNNYTNNLGLRASFGVWMNPFSFGLSYTNMSEEPYFNDNRNENRRVQTETFHAEAASSFFFFLGFFLSLYILFYSS